MRSLRPLQSKRRSPKPPAHHVRSLRPLQSKRRSPKPPPHHVQGCQTATQVFCLSSFKPAPSKASMHIPGREHQSVLPDMRNGGPAVGVWSVATTVSVSASVDGECEPLWPSGTLPSPRRSPMPDEAAGGRTGAAAAKKGGKDPLYDCQRGWKSPSLGLPTRVEKSLSRAAEEGGKVPLCDCQRGWKSPPLGLPKRVETPSLSLPNRVPL